MKRLLKSPHVNAACISAFSAFYAIIFFATAQSAAFQQSLQSGGASSFWPSWSRFLAQGHQRKIAVALIAATLLVVVLLLLRREPHDEYHTAILLHCLAAAAVSTLAAIAIFYLLLLANPAGIIEKFTLFIVIHWATVVLANLSYVLLCRWR